MAGLFAIFHLNLAYSSIAVDQRPEVIRRCYWPLLDLIDRLDIPVGIELTGWTLVQIQLLAPDWVAQFRLLLSLGKCELIGSGYCQIIGPLVPAQVNTWNQHLGLESYQSILGVKPDLALVNEMAFSEGLISIYHDAGYTGLVMDSDNVRLALGDGAQPPDVACDAAGVELPVLWTDSILFQKFQRYVHGEICIDDYMDYLSARLTDGESPLCLYSNDAEIFGYRPGRFSTEPPLHGQDEWQRIYHLLDQVSRQRVEWLSPSAALIAGSNSRRSCRITSAAFPVPVKKQPKYNLSRWAITGRDDLGINSACFRAYKALSATKDIGEDIRRLCEHWASDYRTHIEDNRWTSLADNLTMGDDVGSGSSGAHLPDAELPCSFYSHEGMVLNIHTDEIQLSLNLRRGLSIRSLAFKAHDFVPLVGTQLHGYFHSIDLGADFFSGNLVAEYAETPFRVTDLEWVEPEIQYFKDAVRVSGKIETPLGRIEKSLLIPTGEARVQVSIESSLLPRRQGRVRVAAATLLTQNMQGDAWYETHNGGYYSERFILDSDFDHGQAVSPIVSCTTGLGATEGWVSIGDDLRGIKISWDPSSAAVFPQVSCRQVSPSPFLRLSLSLMESDDTFVCAGSLPNLSYSIEAI